MQQWNKYFIVTVQWKLEAMLQLINEVQTKQTIKSKTTFLVYITGLGSGYSTLGSGYNTLGSNYNTLGSGYSGLGYSGLGYSGVGGHSSGYPYSRVAGLVGSSPYSGYGSNGGYVY